MKFTNSFLAVALILGGLSITEKITFIIGVVALVLACFANIEAFRKNRAQRKLAEREMKKNGK